MLLWFVIIYWIISVAIGIYAAKWVHNSRDFAIDDLSNAQTEDDVLGDAEVGEERVRLEHHRQPALGRRKVRHVAIADADRARGGGVEARDEPQGRRLSAPGRAQQHHEGAGLGAEGDAVEGARLSPMLGDAFELDG